MGDLAEKIITSAKTSLIDCNTNSIEDLRPKLLFNDNTKGNAVLCNIEKELNDCDSFIFSVAFITMSGVTILLETLKVLEQRGIKGKILTTDYLSFNEPKALAKLLEFSNIEIKIFTKENFHTKGYIFQNSEKYTFIVGSSNLTQYALKKNKEWNLKITSLENGELIREILQEFNQMWHQAEALTTEWINKYSLLYMQQKEKVKEQKLIRIKQRILEPNKMQMEAVRNLLKLREQNKNKAVLISATGTGKTYLSAFDARNFGPKKLLFLVHREQILKQAEDSFKDVFGEAIKTGFLTGNVKDLKADYLFSTVQMMSKENVINQFNSDYFDYIIIDETHKAGADSYLKIINYFKPQFLLGMTATPERMDGFNIFELFDYNIAYEIRLQQAMEEDMLCPFHYFGISELTIEGEVIDDVTDFNKLVSDVRVDNIIDKIEFYGYCGDRVRGLIFCSRQDEARKLSKSFNLRGYQTLALCGEATQDQREEAIKKLEQPFRDSGLDYIFTVDIFNEGVDIPCINQVVMLRPTQSSIIFIQQLGRGLRKDLDKDYVIVIDFIGNYNKNFLIPIALSGDRTYNKDTIRKYVAEGNRVIPGCSTVNFDAIAKQRIYAAIDTANFSDVKLIKEEYQNLKNMIGRIPKLQDFEVYGSIDVMRIFDNKNLGSYHNFLKKYDRDYTIKLNSNQEEMLEFISQKIAKGKRIHELQVLKRLLHYQKGIMKIVANDLLNEYGKSLTKTAENNIASVLTNHFITNDVGKRKFSNSVFLEKDGEDYKVSNAFWNAIQDEVFYDLINDLIDYGIRRHQNMYGDNYKITNFVLYQKYTYEDVCKLLDWDNNIVAQNIGGYKYDKGTNTFPVFINYNKDETISDSIKYEDRFVSPSIIIALSKQTRTPESKDVQQIYRAKENGTKIYLFIRKNKDDNTSKEFYFLGEINALGEPKAIIMRNTNKNAVEITYQLETSVREDVYAYLTE